ncbi:MAG: M28 family peptidase [Planctomycetota bacterium]
MLDRLNKPARLLLAFCLLSQVTPVREAASENPDRNAAVQGDRFDGKRAYGYLKQVCGTGPRISGTEGMLKQQQLLLGHFRELGAEAWLQEFSYRHPLTGRRVQLANLIVEWRPEAEERILLCAHYDTRPYPDRDPNPRLRRAVFLGANDGGSGVAALMELGNHVDEMPTGLGLDFVFFDAEELVYDDRKDKYFLGSTWFARQYRKKPPAYRYQAGVLLDMVGDKELSVFQETRSATMPSTRPIVKEIWSTAERLGVEEFIPVARYEVSDDHLPLNNIAKITTIDVIDFNYPDRWNRFWHTTQDTPARCSAESLGKVGWVIQNWLHDRLAVGNQGATAGE